MKVRRRGRSLPPSPPTEGWKSEELDLRRREVAAAERTTRSQKWVQLGQVLSVVVALASTLVALFAALQSNKAAQSAAEASAQQTAESQLTSAISSLDVGNSSVRITQMLLIGRDITGIMSLPLSTSKERQDAYNDYITTLQTLSLYLSSHTPAPFMPGFGRGYGIPSIPGMPLDTIYAANTLERLLSMEARVMEVATPVGIHPAIDLANEMLFGQPWVRVNFSWIFAYLVGIDLRGADLESSRWSSYSDLSHSYLQCADLEGADFHGANLTYADLRGADVQGANFRGADLKGAIVTSLYGNANWPQGAQGITTLPAKEWNQAACLRDKLFWDNQSVSASAPSSLPSL